jgi:deoxyinosine 3'endonuclease (endonuclease V)
MNKVIQTYINFQSKNAKYIIQKDIFKKEEIQFVGGLDISFKKDNSNTACAFLTIFDIKSNIIIYEDYNVFTLEFPYISGCLGLREVPHYLELLYKIESKSFYPQLLMVDGFGVLHQREYGSASELGHKINLPTIGIGKTLLSIDGLNETEIKNFFKTNCKTKGDYMFLIGKSKKIFGAALKSSNNSSNPIYVSIGYGISLETSIEFVNKLCIHRIPEPIRNSDIKSKLYF